MEEHVKGENKRNRGREIKILRAYLASDRNLHAPPRVVLGLLETTGRRRFPAASPSAAGRRGRESAGSPIPARRRPPPPPGGDEFPVAAESIRASTRPSPPSSRSCWRGLGHARHPFPLLATRRAEADAAWKRPSEEVPPAERGREDRRTCVCIDRSK